MVEPDPWNVIDTKAKPESNVNSAIESSSNTTNNTPATFEDNFTPAVFKNSSNDSLPDSQEYIQVLERRLAKLKRITNYLDQLKARREHCIANLLIGNINLTDGIADNSHLEADFEITTRRELLRYFQPEQANNLIELLAIVDHDQLNGEDSLDTEPDINSQQ